MRSRHGTVTPKQQARRITNHGKATATVGCNHDGRADQHPLPTVLYDVTHNHQHHRGRRQVIQISRDHEGGQRDGPQQALRVPSADPFGDKVEAAVIVQELNDTHRGQQEHHDTGGTAHIIQEDLVVDKELHRITRRRLPVQECHILYRVMGHHEVRTITDIDHPPHRCHKHGNGSFVHTGKMTCGDHDISQQQ